MTNLNNVERHLMTGHPLLHKSLLERIKAHIGVALQKEGVICDPLIDRLGVIASGVWNAATESATPKLKPLEWGDNGVETPPEGSNRYSYLAWVATKFGTARINYFSGSWNLRVDGIYISDYPTLEEAKEGAWEWYQSQVATLYL